MSIQGVGPPLPGESPRDKPVESDMKNPNAKDLEHSKGVKRDLKEILSVVGGKVPLPLRAYFPGGSKLLTVLVKGMKW